MIDFDNPLGATKQILDAAAVRTRVILHNIANQNVPGYKRFTVSFEDQMRRAVEAGESTDDIVPIVTRDMSGAPGQNNVDVMQELALLDKVKLVHELFTRRAGGYFSHLNKAILGRA